MSESGCVCFVFLDDVDSPEHVTMSLKGQNGE